MTGGRRHPEGMEGAEEVEGAGREELARWLRAEVARHAGLPADAVDPRRPIAGYGLDSLAAIELAHALEERTGAAVDLDVLFSEASVDDLAELALRPAASAPDAAAVASEAGGEVSDDLPGDLPLSRAQLSLWFLHALDPESPAYNVPNAVRVLSDLDEPALLAALDDLAARHPALRTTFAPPGGQLDGEPRQRIAAAGGIGGGGGIEVFREDASAWTEEELAERLAAEGARPFDLARGPLARLGLYGLAGGGTALLLSMHHIVTDLWSLGVLLDDLGELYAAHRSGPSGRSPALPPPPPSYADFTLRQERELAGPEGEALWDYWRGRLAGDLPRLDLPADRPRPRVQTTAGSVCRRALAAPLAVGVRARAQAAATTPFVVAYAAFAALLHRYTGESDLLLGTVSAARGRAVFARTVGYFVNPLVLRADLSGDPPFADLLARARGDALGAFAHGEYPFPLLVERLQPRRDPGRTPLFQTMLAWQKGQLGGGQDLTGFALAEPGARIDLGDLALEVIPLPQRIAQFDLTLTMGEVGGRLVASFDYNVDLFDGATVLRLAGHFEHLLAAALAEPDRPLSELPLLDAAEARQLVESWNDTAVPYRDGASLAELFAERAAAAPEATAALFAGRELTYGELARRAAELARALRHLGVGPETLVALCVERSFDVLVAALGILLAGGAYLPIDPEYPRERIAHLLQSSGARLALVHEALRPLVESAGGPRVLSLDGQREEIAKLAAGSSSLPPAPGGSHLSCCIYTSGSTGLPKGVLLEHRSLSNLVASFARSYQPGPGDRILPLTSIAYASFVGEVFPLLSTGGAVVLPQKHEILDAAALVSLVARAEVTMVSTVPSMLPSLAAMGERLPRLRLLLVGGEALSAADLSTLAARAGALRIVNGYGLTETAICSTIYDVTPADLAAGRPLSSLPIGRPLMNQRLYVLDRHLRPLPVGCAGELHVAGDGLARGYLARPAETAARFLPDPFAIGGRMYRTGDLAAWRAGGDLAYLGRADRQVKLRGVRIELPEIEAALAAHPRVAAAAAQLRQDDGEPRLVGYVVVQPGEPAPPAGDFLAWLRGRLPEAMVPAALVFLDALPRNPHGKVEAARLPAPEHVRPDLAAAYAAPRSALERAIATVWREALPVDAVGLDDSFFDLGGHSLLMTRVHARLKEALGREVSLIELFQYPTVGSLARHLSSAETSAPAAPAPRAREARGETDLAVVGLAGRFPGSPDVEGLWASLVAAREGIAVFTAEELVAAGVDPALVARDDYVKAKGILGGVDLFDAPFFALNPREVELMDPQHRLFLECAWEALEDAGWVGERYAGRVGVYAGESMNTYMLMNLLPHMELVASADTLQASLGNDKDPLTARVSYKLDLKGPSVTIQSASSTSLVAVHHACQALINHDCDMALAGGVSIHLPEKTGYLYQEGGTVSRDGHCRAFDAASTGFVSGHGCGVVVLKRLSEALADRDHIYAVVKGSACNNDGAHKVSFMAPSVDGQIELYRQAYENAGVDPATVSYVECHGTGTALGDPIEIAALSQAFRAASDRRGWCAIGSLKTNIGHLDTAAGVCGLIKAVLALHHRTIPPTLHFQNPNPRIDFAASPFFVNTELRPWESAEGAPRRAGVTSLGMGGTNAHVVLEEAPVATENTAADHPARPWQVLVLSAKSAAALDAATARLAEHLRRRPELPLGDVAYTLQAGRKAFAHRRALPCRDLAEAAAALAARDPERVLSARAEPGDHPVAFLFPGQGAQYVGMGRGLYAAEPVFREAVDRCCDLLPFDLRGLMFGSMGADDSPEAAERLQRTEHAQPALFVVSWAAAQLWLSWGVRPAALLGHSIGEYAAACLAGVFSLEDALALVVERGRLMQGMAPGAMLAVPLPTAEVGELLARAGGAVSSPISLAAVNRPDLAVVSGDAAALDEIQAELALRGVVARRLHTSHAFHSATADPILAPFAAAVARARLAPPSIPVLSNLTGTWLRAEEATDPGYWARHLRSTVRFADGLAELLAEPQRILLEVGPGDTLSTHAREHPARRPGQAVVASLRHPKSAEEDAAVLARAVARLWLAGGEVDWDAYGAAEARRRVSLPSYPFERRRYWVDPLPKAGGKSAALPRREARDWTHVPVWKQAPRPRERWGSRAANGAARLWLICLDAGLDAGADLGARLAARLAAAGERTVRAFAGDGFARLDEATYTVAPGSAADLEALVAALDRPPTRAVHLCAVHLWSLGASAADPRRALDRSFHGLAALAQALGRRSAAATLVAVTAGAHEVTGEERLAPLQAAALGALAVVSHEPCLNCRTIDLLPPEDGAAADLAAGQIAAEALRDGGAEALPWVAFRRGRRFVRAWEPLPLAPRPEGEPPRLRRGGVCLVTGGLGELGLALAERLARDSGARLALVDPRPFPPREEWPITEDEAIRSTIRRLQAIEEAGGEVLTLAADVADPAAVAPAIAAAERRFGSIDGVVHAAAHAGGPALAPGVQGALALAAALAGRPLDLFVLAGSAAAVLKAPGHAEAAEEAAAGAVFETFAALLARRGVPAAAILWDGFDTTLTARDGAEVFARVVESGLAQVVVSALGQLGAAATAAGSGAAATAAASGTAATAAGSGAAAVRPANGDHPRPELANPYAPPESELEREIAGIWREILGVDPIGLYDNFFELGGNSLAGLRVVGRLKERLQAGVSEVSLYEAPTVATLARLIGAAAADESGLAAAPSYAGSRSRGEERRARQLRKARAGPEGALPVSPEEPYPGPKGPFQ